MAWPHRLVDHRDALRAARSIIPEPILSDGQLNKPLEVVQEWCTRLLDRLEFLAVQAYVSSADKVKEIVGDMTALWDQAKTSLGQKARELSDMLLEAFDRYIQTLVSRALSRIRSRVEVAGTTLAVASVDIDQTVKFSATVQSSIAELAKFIVEGEIVVRTRYSGGADA